MDPDLFFEDGIRSIDYVLVYSRKQLRGSSRVTLLETFVHNLQKIGFEYESRIFSRNNDIRFVLLHFSEENMMDYVIAFKIDLTMNSVIYKFRNVFARFLLTFLTDPDKNDELYLRAEETFRGDKPTGITSAEKIYLVNEILNKTRFGDTINMYGISSLIKSGSLKTAYPLHTGTYKWTSSGPLSDRQLLYEFWARPKRWYKEQPNNVIEKYFGTEYAFYFKWMRLYTLMLLIPAIFSLIVIIYGFASMYSKENTMSKEICKSDSLICPSSSRTKYYYAKSLCVIFHTTYVLNNTASTMFAILISLWSAILIEMWKRIEFTYQMKWNVKNMEQDLSMRMEYKERAHYREVAVGELEQFVPLTYRIIYSTATILIVISTAVVIMGLTILTLILRLHFARLWSNKTSYRTEGFFTLILPQVFSNVTIAIMMIILQQIYYKISFIITKYEIPRTAMDFDNSYIYKCYLLDCINHFGSLMFFGFIMGRVLDHPGIVTKNFFHEPFYRNCLGFSCTFEMAALQLTIWLVRSCYNLATRFLIPYLTVKKRLKSSKFSNEKLKQWEYDYLLNKCDRYLIAHEYLDTVIEYGFVTFFISSFPLAPLCGFLTSLLHLRVDAFKFLRLYRRPNAKKIPKLISFTKLLQSTTYVGIITNAAMIAFNSDLVPKEIYRLYTNTSLEGISTQQFSEIKTSMVYSYYNYTVKEDTCYFNNILDKNQKKTLLYWWVLAMRFAVLLGIEHIVFLVQGLLAYMIPDVPFEVMDTIAREKKIQREQSMGKLEVAFVENKKKSIKESERFVLIQ